MMRKIALIYRFYHSLGLRNPYLDTLLSLAFSAYLHLLILLELLLLILPQQKGIVSIHNALSSNYAPEFGLGIFLISLIGYPKKKLLNVNIDSVQIKQGVVKIGFYHGFLLAVLLILERTH